MPTELFIPVNTYGQATSDTPISYTIRPSGTDPAGQPAYRAATAQLAIYRNNGLSDVRYKALAQGTITETLMAGYPFTPGDAYEVQTVLNYGYGNSEIWSSRAPVKFGRIYLESYDPTFPNVKLRYDDYYPALGGKRITVKGLNENGTPMTGKKVKATIVSPVDPIKSTYNIGVNGNTSGNPTEPLANGTAEFTFSTAPNLGPMLNNDPLSGANQIQIEFSLVNNDGSDAGQKFYTYWNVKTNANTNLQEVLEGKAVFTYDTQTGENHKGKTTANADEYRELDYVQMMINHIMPPLMVPVNEANLRNTLWVDGVYGGNTKKAIEVLITGGPMTFMDDQNNQFTITLDTGLMIQHRIGESSGQYAPRTLEKLAADYSGSDLLAAPGKVIDKDILVGLNKSSADHHPKNHNDIGILELYENDDWDGDGLSNYVEVENGIDPLVFSDNYFPKNVPGSTIPANIMSLNLAYPQGTHSSGKLVKGLRSPHSSKGYYQQRGSDVVDSDNFALPDVLNRLERVAKIWRERHPDLTPLKANIFCNGDTDNNLYTDDGRKDSSGNPQVNGIRFGMGDLSRAGGGPFYKLDANGNIVYDNNGKPIIEHSSHQNGLDVDVRYVRKNNTEGNVAVIDSVYSALLSNELVELFFTEGGAIRVIVDFESRISSDQYGTYIIYDTLDDGKRDHIDHFHVAFANSNTPTGNIDLVVTQTQIEANGDKTLIIESSQPIKDTYGLNLYDGFYVEVETDMGIIYSKNDQNLGQLADILVDSTGKIKFKLRVSGTGTAHISADTRNVYNQGHASGSANLAY